MIFKKTIIKIFLFLFLALSANTALAGLISVDQFITPDDVTIAHLEALRATVVDEINGYIDYDNIEDDGILEEDLGDEINPRVRWDEAFNDFVYSGLLPPTAASLTTTTTAGTAYINGYRVTKASTEHTYTASKWTFVDLSQNGTYTYQEVVIGAAEPSVTANSMRLCRVSSDTTTILAVRDDRVLSIATSTNEDHYRKDLTISVVTPDTITISSGVAYHGTTRLAKTASTSLALGTAADWVDGVSARGTDKYGYVVIDSSGNIKLTDTAPTKADTSGNTDGKLRYCVVSSTYYRLLAWFYMNDTGSGNINYWEYGNFKDGDVKNVADIYSEAEVSETSTAIPIQLDDFTIHYYSAGEPLNATFRSTVNADATRNATSVIVIDDVTQDVSNGGTYADNHGTGEYYTLSSQYSGILTQGTYKFAIQWKTNAGTIYSQKRRFRIEE